MNYPVRRTKRDVNDRPSYKQPSLIKSFGNSQNLESQAPVAAHKRARSSNIPVIPHYNGRMGSPSRTSRRSLAGVGLSESARCHGPGLVLLTNEGVQQQQHERNGRNKNCPVHVNALYFYIYPKTYFEADAIGESRTNK
ncbi:hypothetical protein TNCV_3367811 [Trichonephila clavipes]|nr:hypothetical protein TNCV_3367811 [Trichonephila clavipes]